MPRTVEHIAETHQAVAELRAAGKPVWNETVDLPGFFHDDTLTIEEKAQRTAAALKASRWVRTADEHDSIHELIEYLEGVDDRREFNGVLSEIYDEADSKPVRVWITTR
jgi:hypothetical protein